MMITASYSFAQTHTETIEGLTYSIDEKTNAATLVANPDEKYSGDIVVPEKVTAEDGKEYPVVAFGKNCFTNCPNLTNITIPSSVISLGDYCFWMCSGLTNITIPSSVTSLGDNCFTATNITNFIIPSSVVSIGDYCFSSCNITTITIPSSVKSLGTNSFSSCSNLSSIYFDGSLPNTIIGTEIPNTCLFYVPNEYLQDYKEALKDKYKFVYSKDTDGSQVAQAHFELIDGMRYLLNDEDQSAILTKLQNGYYPNEVVVPEKVVYNQKEYTVTSLGDYCFKGHTDLRSIVIPSSVTALGDYCFGLCYNLTNIEIPSSVTSIGTNCFCFCKELSDIKIPSSVSSLGDWCFFSCKKLTDITIPSSVTTLGNGCFTFCSQLETLYFEGELPKGTSGSDIPTTSKLYVPKDYLQDYKDALGSKYPYIFAKEDATNINSIKTSGITINSNNGSVTISGLNDGEMVTFFSPDGRQIGDAKAENGTASCTVAESSLVIAKVGNKAFKIAVKK